MRLRTPTDIGLLIRETRRARGLDQAELARRVGVSRQWIIGIEKGKGRADLSLVLRTVEALGIALRSDEPSSAKTRKPSSAVIVSVDDILAAHRGRRSRSP
jgi:HTH-type transcriptional regulator/antitoxin HipB